MLVHSTQTCLPWRATRRGIQCNGTLYLYCTLHIIFLSYPFRFRSLTVLLSSLFAVLLCGVLSVLVYSLASSSARPALLLCVPVVHSLTAFTICRLSVLRSAIRHPFGARLFRLRRARSAYLAILYHYRHFHNYLLISVTYIFNFKGKLLFFIKISIYYLI